jgi:O-acetyl-ADP-ribose deacetylase (regulator of RNase III)
MYEITLKQGDLFQEKSADFIVNPSNTALILGSGVSGAFRRVCGDELQKEMSKYAPIKQAEVVKTICPNHPEYKYALHVAIMDYSSDNPSPTYETIKKSLQNIENVIKDYSPCKIVLPLMGVGVGGLDKKKVILIYKEFFNKKTDFECEVVIYGYKKEDFKLLKKVFGK